MFGTGRQIVHEGTLSFYQHISGKFIWGLNKNLAKMGVRRTTKQHFQQRALLACCAPENSSLSSSLLFNRDLASLLQQALVLSLNALNSIQSVKGELFSL
jgi:hypothetical protein